MTALKYAKSELRPPTPAEIPQAIAGISGLVASFGRRSWRKLTVRVGEGLEDSFLLVKN